ncbi:hypothetical protein TWF730_005396 [Orbilia blumenaviensis]|uniref:RecA family profile 1 domain-containing protein n=1 Tax=Orbilia blumenaviensis TaxID=1796055 RepID=A0AAV9VLJ4_9PEZI
MTDILTILPNIYRTNPNLRSLLDRHSPSFDQCGLTTVDLVTLDPRSICQRARISLNDVNKIVDAIRDVLNAETLGGPVNAPTLRSGRSTPTGTPMGTPTGFGFGGGGGDVGVAGGVTNFRGRNMEALSRRQRVVGLGDEGFDAVLNGGFVTGSLVEVVGESGVGKTQLLLRLCFSIQQPPHNRSAIYICTESQISTKRMISMLDRLVSQEVEGYKSLSTDKIQTAMCQYPETLEHIVRYQLPIAIERFGVGLVVVDSIAANFRVVDDEAGDDLTSTRGGAKGRTAKLAKRAGDVVRLGMCLKEMAVKYNVAVVVANQVSDTFEPGWMRRNKGFMPPPPSSAPPASSFAAMAESIESSMGTQGMTQAQQQQGGSQEIPLAMMSQYGHPTDDLMMTYDYQAKWFTGWGEGIDDDDDIEDEVLLRALGKLKTPMLGMSWTNLLDGRVALVKGSAPRGSGGEAGEGEGGLVSEDGESEGRTRRWVKVVFAPWAESGVLLEYEIWEGGVRSVRELDTGGGEARDED